MRALGLLEQMFVHDGYHIEKVNAPNNAVPTNPLGYDVIVILGGSMAVYENLPYLQKSKSHKECHEE